MDYKKQLLEQVEILKDAQKHAMNVAEYESVNNLSHSIYVLLQEIENY